MSRKQIEAVVWEMAVEIAEAAGMEVVDVEYVKEPEGYFLRVFIDKPGGVDLNDCQRVSMALDTRLDEVDPIPGSYSLEVSSPGVERPLKKPKDFERFAGSEVRLRTYGPIDGRKNWKGKLVGLSGDRVALLVDGREVAIPYESIARVNLVAEF